MSGVYFARLGSLIKIGYSIDPVKRAKGLNATLLAVIEGGTRDEESGLHQRFADARTTGEWFKPTAALRAYIKTLPAVEPPPRRKPQLSQFSRELLAGPPYSDRVHRGFDVLRNMGYGPIVDEVAAAEFTA